jgi:hypothetical protein
MIRSDSNSINIGDLIKHGYVWAVYPKSNGTVDLEVPRFAEFSLGSVLCRKRRPVPSNSCNEWTYVLSYGIFITCGGSYCLFNIITIVSKNSLQMRQENNKKGNKIKSLK